MSTLHEKWTPESQCYMILCNYKVHSYKRINMRPLPHWCTGYHHSEYHKALVRLTKTILHRNQVPKLFTANRILFIYSQLLVLLIGCLVLPPEYPRPGAVKVAAHEPVPLVNVNKWCSRQQIIGLDICTYHYQIAPAKASHRTCKQVHNQQKSSLFTGSRASLLASYTTAVGHSKGGSQGTVRADSPTTLPGWLLQCSAL
jgi:hypothetical protein